MASGEIEVIPGRVFAEEELIEPASLNQLGTPTLRVKEQSITSREIADGTITSDKLDVDLEAQITVADNSITTNKILSGAVTSSKLADDAKLPIGMVVDFGGSAASVPSGWLLCGGQAVSRTTYASLFGVLGVLWGSGDGTTTFNVPDLRGYVTAGKDDMVVGAAGRLTSTYITGGGGPTTLGGFGGAQSHTLTVAQLASHNHPPLAGQTAFLTYGAGGAGFSISGAWGSTYPSGDAGSNGAHNNVQPTRIMNKIIRYL